MLLKKQEIENILLNIFNNKYNTYNLSDSSIFDLKIGKRILKKEGEKHGFKRSYRASLDRIKSISINIPDIEIQETADKKITYLEEEISDFNQKIYLLEKQLVQCINDFIL